MSAPTGPESCEAYTVAWITALALERAAAVAMLDERYNDPPPGFRKNVSDDNAYSWGRVGKHNVVISSLPAGQYGTNATATIAQGLRSSLPHIRIGLLVGIGAGIPGTHFGKGNKPAIRRDIRLGDVVVSMPNGTIGGVVQIDLVKAGRRNSDGEEIVERKGFLNSPPMAICTALMKLQANHEIEDSVIPSLLTGTFQKWPKMKAHYSHPGIDRPGFEGKIDVYHAPDGSRIVREARLSPDIHYGIIASSNTLEKSAEHRDDMLARLKAENIEPMCLEMEAAGLMNGFPCLIIRGVCDYADEHKNDDWQKYAAVTAAAFAKELLGCTDVEEVRSAPEIGRMLDKIELVNTRISHLQNNVSAQRRDSVLHWLCPHDYSNELEDYKTRRHPGTGQWFLQHSAFLDWVNASGCSTLSCAGEPGTGKTIMSTLIIDYLIDQEPNINNTVLYIFCNYKRRVEQTLMHFFASILRQLAFLSHGVFGAVEQLHDHHKTRNSRPSLQNLQSELEGAFKLSGSVYIIIDALDECEVGICKQLVKWIRDQMPHCKIHLLATTRDIGEIQTLFLKDPSLRIQATREDLERYSEHRMTEFTEEIQSDLRLRDNVVEGVVDAADGMFLLARLHIDSLKYQITPNDLRETLRALRGGNEAGEYGAYSAAYETAMERVESQHKRRRDLAMRIFAWIVHAKRPLRLVELQHALATRRGKNQLDPGDFVSNTTVLSVCAGLVSSDNQSSIVRLVHYTAQAFFEKAWRQWFLEETMAIAETCTVYLSFGAFAKGPCTTDDSMIRRYQEHALLRYAAQYWGDHIRVLEATQDIVSSPFKNTFMSFLNDKNLVSSATQAMPASSYSYVGEITSRICRASGIHFTARFGAVGLTALLVSHGQTVNAEDSNHQTPLVLAAWNGHEAVVRLLLDIGADVSVKSDYGTPLQTASKKGYDKIVQMLVDGGADANAQGGKYGTALWIASARGYDKVVQILVDRGADVNAQGGEYGTALWAALAGNYDKIVQVLVNGGADVNPQVGEYGTALQAASARGYDKIVQILVDSSADVNAQSGLYGTALQAASARGYDQIVQILADGGADVNAQGGLYSTALQAASEHGYYKIVQMLLDRGADVNAQGGLYSTAIQTASARGYDKIVQILVDRGADVNARGGKYGTALQAACRYGYDKIAQILVDRGADVNTPGGLYGTALQAASASGYDKIVEILVGKGAVTGTMVKA